MPARWNRVFGLAVLPCAKLFIEGNEELRDTEITMKSTVLLTSLPIILIGVLSVFSLTIQLKMG